MVMVVVLDGGAGSWLLRGSTNLISALEESI